jgi:hypothetical protein
MPPSPLAPQVDGLTGGLQDKHREACYLRDQCAALARELQLVLEGPGVLGAGAGGGPEGAGPDHDTIAQAQVNAGAPLSLGCIFCSSCALRRGPSFSLFSPGPSLLVPLRTLYNGLSWHCHQHR